MNYQELNLLHVVYGFILGIVGWLLGCYLAEKLISWINRKLGNIL